MWKSLFKTFYRSQISSFVGGMSDYGFMLLLTEMFGVYYPVSIVCSGIFGAVINFTINRYWSFEARGEQKRKQIPRFVIMVIGSIALKSGGTYGLTELIQFPASFAETFNVFDIQFFKPGGHLDYKVSRILVDIVVAIGFNYMLQRFWVFRKGMKQEED